MENIFDIKRFFYKLIALICTFILFITPLVPIYSANVITTASSQETAFSARKYAFTDDQLRRIASMCYAENGSSENAMRAEASLMANLYEKNGDKKGTTSGFIKYITTGGWFASASVAYYNNPVSVSSKYLAAVKDVLINGNRYFPVYVDEHDWMGDITSVSNNGVTFNKNNRSSYIKDVTVIKNCYGATYTFYCFPDSSSDPFGYISKKTNSGTLTSIEIKTKPTKTEYNVGDSLNTKGLSLVAKYSNGGEEIITQGFDYSPKVLNSEGTQVITVTYKTKKMTFEVKVNKKTVDMSGVKFEDKTVKYNGKAQSIKIDEETLPQGVTVTYKGNEKIDAGEYIVTAKFLVDTSKYNEIEDKTATLTIEKIDPIVNPKYDTKRIIYEDESLPEIKLSEGDTEGIIIWNEDVLEVGEKEYEWTFTPTDTINYNTITGSIDITVEEVRINNIDIKKQPDKVNYYVGDNLDIQGLVIEAIYNNGKIEDITDSIVCTPTELEVSGEQEIRVTYGEKIATFKVTVEEVQVSSIEVKTNPIKLNYYVGDNLNVEGLVITVIYNNGKTEDIVEGFTYNPVKLEMPGKQEIIVMYEGRTTMFTVTVERVFEAKDILKDYSKYQVEQEVVSYITNIMQKTSIEEYKKELEEYDIEIYNIEGNKITDEKEYIKTNMKMKVYKNQKQLEEYTLVVLGDLNGDGEMNDIDLLMLVRYKTKSDKNLSDPYLKASDILRNGIYEEDADLLKMARILVGLDKL
ncbi:MAG: bacterial Ig-like domain-containing protein [Clostridia bacterium]|nr:bacterial Ig-like domain-containing protein [Clostridia bacterium]